MTVILFAKLFHEAQRVIVINILKHLTLQTNRVNVSTLDRYRLTATKERGRESIFQIGVSLSLARLIGIRIGTEDQAIMILAEKRLALNRSLR